MKVSVVIPCYNSEKYLEQCLNSIEAQTVKPYETIVVNDGSTDSTEQIALKHKCIVVRNYDNMGIGYSRWRGAEAAKGEYVAFLSSDDAYNPYYLELMLKHANGLNALYSDYWRCDAQLNPKTVFLAPRFKTSDEFEKLVVEWCLRSNMFVCFSTVMIPKHFFEYFSFHKDLRFGEDLVFLLDSLTWRATWTHVDLPLMYYRVHPSSGTGSQWNLERRKQMWSYLHPSLIKLGVDPFDSAKAATQSFKKLKRGRLTRFIPPRIKALIKKTVF